MAGPLSGIGCTLLVADAGGTQRDLSDSVFDFTLGTPRAQWDITALQDPAMRRILLLADATVSINGIVNTTANSTHDVFKTVPSDASTVTRAITLDLPDSLTGCPEFTSVMSVHDYQIKRPQNAQQPFTVPMNNANGSAPAWGVKS